MEKDSHIIEIIDRLSRIEQIGASTLEQCKRTNGRTTELEKKVDSLEATRDQQSGSWKTASMIGGVVATLVYFFIDKIWK